MLFRMHTEISVYLNFYMVPKVVLGFLLSIIDRDKCAVGMVL